ncbi:hypothetical protein BCY91_07965 [Pelobium manganitolerans]|uniref:Uncharacterized protein n=1 Tax=Pelobium manganitolerans TaxID=1842495 RepID=A0A419S458_9SPHI|nr:hypothetical protein BCY91_07965 [Pelobium manganitolerans]
MCAFLNAANMIPKWISSNWYSQYFEISDKKPINRIIGKKADLLLCDSFAFGIGSAQLYKLLIHV